MASKYIDNSNYAASGYTLSGVFQSITVGAAGVIGGPGIIGGANEAYTIVNRGDVTGTNTGMSLQDGGTVANAGTIMATGSTAIAIYIAGVGVVTNAANDLLEAAYGVRLEIGTLHNSGTVDATGTSGVALYLLGGGVTNIVGGLIEGATGISIAGTGGSVANSGTIHAFGQASASGDAVSMRGAGAITNAAGAIIGVAGTNAMDAAIYLNGGSLTNAGTIEADSGTKVGEGYLGQTAIITNGTAVIQTSASSVISGYLVGIEALGGECTINNAGTILGTTGIVINAGGTITNQIGGFISGVSSSLKSLFTSVFNSGTIGRVGLYNGGLLDNDMLASSVNSVEIIGGGTVINDGKISSGVGATSSGDGATTGVVTLMNVGTASVIGFVNAGGQKKDVLVNQGTIGNVAMQGTITNEGIGALIQNGIVINNGSLINEGRILSVVRDGYAVFSSEAKVTNLGTDSVTQGYAGVFILDTSAVTNEGRILATGTRSRGIGVEIGKPGGTVINLGQVINSGKDSLISGYIGVDVATVENFGTIASTAETGGIAVDNVKLLVDDAGSVFVGRVNSVGGTLQLAGVGGTISGIGSEYANFGTVSVLSGASFVLEGENVVAGSFTDSGSLTDKGSITLSSTSIIAGAISGTGTLSFAGGAATLATGSALSVAHVLFSGGTVFLGHSVTDTGALILNGGTISLASYNLTLKGAASFIGGTVSGTGYLVTDAGSILNALILDSGAVWQTFGAVTQTGSLVLGNTGGGSGKLVVESGGAFEIAGDVGVGVAPRGVGSVANVGLFQKASGTGVSTIAASFNDTGTIAIASGTLDFTGVSNSFAGTISGAGAVQFGGGKSTLSAGAVIDSAQAVVSGGTVALGAKVADDGGFAESGGTIVVSGYSLTLNGSAAFTGGTVAGAGYIGTYGTTTLSSLVVTGGAVFQDFTTLTEKGKLVLGDASGGSGRLVVESGHVFDIAANGGISIASGGTGSFVNVGLFEKTAGTGLSVIGMSVNNSGTIAVTSGSLGITGTVDGTGRSTIGSAGALGFAGSVLSTQTIAFAGTTGGELVLDDPSGNGLSFAGAVAGFGGSDRLDLVTFAYSGTPTIGWSQTSSSAGTLTVTDGSKVAKITLFGQYAQSGFGKAPDAGTGTVISYTPPAQVALAAPHH